MITHPTIKSLVLIILVSISVQGFSQELTSTADKPVSDSISNSSLRTKNIMMLGVGSTLLNRDIIAPETENFIQIQLKHFIFNSINVNGNLKKFDIQNYDFDTNGFLSGDLNIEWYISQHRKLSPFIYLGAGILTSYDFEDQNYKVQSGLGLDYLIANKIAIAVSVEANYIYDEQKGSQLLQNADHLYFNALLGLHFYFGNIKSNKSKKLKANQTSVILSNPIEFN